MVKEVRHWMLVGTMVAEDETDGEGGETLDAGVEPWVAECDTDGAGGETLDAGVEPWVAEGETGGSGGETLDAGVDHGLQKVRQVLQEVIH
jgi:hypothetical protein